MKGHEFRCVAIVDASEGQVPSPYALTPEAVDPTEHANDLKQERSLLYVACTRARDDLRISWSGAPSEFLAPLL
jgi:superfamily I DNA/RNA helicase